MKKALVIVLCLGNFYVWAAEGQVGADKCNQYAMYVAEQSMRTIVTCNLDDFVKNIVRRTEGKSFTVYEYLGFSGAGYENLDKFKIDFERAILQARRDTRRLYGPSAKTVILLGGTTDGFGIGYKVIDGLIAQKKLLRQDVIVGGLVSDAAVNYHFEGMEKGWGDLISPYQDVLLLMDVYKEPGQDESWELRESSHGPSATIEVLTKLFGSPNAKSISLELFEGGAIAKKEAKEFFQYWRDRVIIAIKEFPRIVLRPGYVPKKPEKLMGAVPAATDLATDPDVRSSFVFIQPAGSKEMFRLVGTGKKSLNGNGDIVRAF